MTPALAVLVALAATADPPAARKAFWQGVLDVEAFGFNEAEANALRSADLATTDCEIHLVRRPADRRRLTVRFVRDGKEVVAVDGHTRTPFRVDGDTLYFVRYPEGTTGCTVSAHDLTTGKRRWETAVDPFAGVQHSAYANRVTLELTRGGDEKEPAGVVRLAARESYGDYAAVLDRATGAVLATRVYREKFAPPK